MARGGEGAVPGREHVALVAHQAGPGLQGPQPSHSVLPIGEQQGLIRIKERQYTGAEWPTRDLVIGPEVSSIIRWRTSSVSLRNVK